MSSVAQPRTSPQPREGERAWRERSTRFFEELRGPAAAMVRRAFGSGLDDHTIEDIYASAWLATLRALKNRQAALSDDEIRRYLLTAVARHAGKEIRRRKRRPVAALEHADFIGNGKTQPEERAEDRERSRITRDLLASLPRRRRAVLLLRYGWGLEPGEVCNLIEGLSPRAYRKEITRGIDQLTEQLRKLESGAWCADREPILKAFAAGVADEEQRRQAQHHLAHCRHCADFVGKLSGHLHDLGGGMVALPGAVDLAADGRVSVPDRLSELGDRIRESVGGLLGRGGSEASDPVISSVPAAAPKGAGAAGAGMLAKLAGLGMAGKAAVACIGGGAVAAVCVAGGVGPIELSRDSSAGDGRVVREKVVPETAFDNLPRGGSDQEPPSDEGEQPPPEEVPPPPPPPDEPPPAPEPDPIDAPAPVEQFGAIPASGSSGGGGSSSAGAAAAQEFGP